MTNRILAAIAVAAAVAVPTANATQQTLKTCGTVSVKGWTFHVGEVALPGCVQARTLTKSLATMQLPKAGFVHYPGVHLSMRCFAAAGKFKGVSSVQIQCSSADGRKSLISIARR